MKKELYQYNIGKTTDVMIKKAEEKNLDLVGQIAEEIFNDDENDTSNLLRLYKEANETERAIMDSMLVSICGWTMNTIIENAEKEENVLDED